MARRSFVRARGPSTAFFNDIGEDFASDASRGGIMLSLIPLFTV